MRRHTVNETSPVANFLRSQETKGMLRFLTCGSVDDGKSTLIGRLLYESRQIFDDQLASLTQDSKKAGTQGGELDLALLTDGLQAEREQGITIDVAYRFFSTDKRSFIVADTPGHEQYTRNMVTGASTAELAIVLIDARKGVLTQTRRHTYLAHLLGIKSILVAVNKIDLTGYSESLFNSIVNEYNSFVSELRIPRVWFVPVSALNGDNITHRSSRTGWYRGPTLVEILESAPSEDTQIDQPLRISVQNVTRPNSDFRGFQGSVSSGSLSIGDLVGVYPGAQTSTVRALPDFDGDRQGAAAGDSITFVLGSEIDISRGDLIADPADPPEVSNQFEGHLVWMNKSEMLPQRSYYLKIGSRTVGVTIDRPKYRINVNTLEHVASPTLQLNDIGVCNFTTDRPIAFDSYSKVRTTGSFVIIDRLTNGTIGAGMITHSLRRASNVVWHSSSVTRVDRERLNRQRGLTLWFTGLSASGKSTIANSVEVELHKRGLHTYLLDGDNLRHGLNRDLGFTDADRIENLRRAASVAHLMNEAGLIVLACFISPFSAERSAARETIGAHNFVEIFVDAPLNVLETRDPKGLYKRARLGEIPNFTGIGSPYEPPSMPDLHLKTDELSIQQCVSSVVNFVEAVGLIGEVKHPLT
jgi:bifunctional enzyme CysN/CysC